MEQPPAPPSGPTNHPLRPYAVPYLATTTGSTEVLPLPSTLPQMQHSLRHSPNRSTSRYDFPSSPGDLDEPPTPELTALLRTYFNAGLFNFISTGVVMPFEVGKTLLQVQWVPREDVDERLAEVRSRGEKVWDEDEDEEEEELSDELEAEAYFTDLSSRPAPPTPSTSSPTKAAHPKDAHTGYLTRRSIFDTSTKPEYTLPVIVQGGTTEMIKAIFRWRSEGLGALWKGQMTTFMIDTLSSAIQPMVLTTLSFAFSASASATENLSLPLEHHAHPGLPLALSVGSFLVTGFILSPLDLLRTRYIVQSSQSRYRKYPHGPLTSLSTIASEEGGWWTTYLHPTVLFPTILDCLIRPLLHLSTPLFIDRVLHIDRAVQPILYGIADLLLSSATLLIVLPIETVRKRLQLQSRAPVRGTNAAAALLPGAGRPFRPCVEIRPQPYAGVVEAVYRIITEETGRLPHPSRKNGKKSSMESSEVREVRGENERGSGVRQLYRGFNVGLTANLVVFLLGLIGNPEDRVAGGWAEM